MKIAVCNDIRQFNDNQLYGREWSARFPGSAWVTSLFERQNELQVEVVSGDIACAYVREGRWRARDIHVVQELDALHGQTLCRLGAVPAVLTLFESPLVAYRSIDRLIRSPISFANCVGPRSIFERIPAQRHASHWPLIFPSRWQSQQASPRPWRYRKNAVLIAANKYWNERKLPQFHSIKSGLRVVRHGLRKHCSATYRSCKDLQLHDDRLVLLDAMAILGDLDVYGTGWQLLDNLPPRWAHKLAKYPDIFRGRCEDKFETARRYRFTIAYENIAFPGYVTEKLIDGLVSGALPIYLGAPDIVEHIPPGTFINVRTLGSTNAIVEYMQHITEPQANVMVVAGQDFLQSVLGQRSTHEGFADWIVSLLRGAAGAS